MERSSILHMSLLKTVGTSFFSYLVAAHSATITYGTKFSWRGSSTYYLYLFRICVGKTTFEEKCIDTNRRKNLKRITVRDGICGESAHGLNKAKTANDASL